MLHRSSLLFGLASIGASPLLSNQLRVPASLLRAPSETFSSHVVLVPPAVQKRRVQNHAGSSRHYSVVSATPAHSRSTAVVVHMHERSKLFADNVARPFSTAVQAPPLPMPPTSLALQLPPLPPPPMKDAYPVVLSSPPETSMIRDYAEEGGLRASLIDLAALNERLVVAIEGGRTEPPKSQMMLYPEKKAKAKHAKAKAVVAATAPVISRKRRRGAEVELGKLAAA